MLLNIRTTALYVIIGITVWTFGDCALHWEVTHYKDSGNGYTWQEADDMCKANGQMLAVVDSQEKWEKVEYVITGGKRYTAEADVYIGLTFTPSINNFTWSNGVRASWTKWFDNEPYYTETRHCVRLDVYANYNFRTTDCSYRHHFVCSYEDTEATTALVGTASTGLKNDMIVGLSVGFGIFLGIGVLICFMCRCCCNFQENKYKHDPVLRRDIKPTKAQALCQHEFSMQQMEGVDYFRAKSSAAAVGSYSRNQFGDDVFNDDDDPVPRFIDVEPRSQTSLYNKKMDDISLNESSSPSTVKSTNYMNFM